MLRNQFELRMEIYTAPTGIRLKLHISLLRISFYIQNIPENDLVIDDD